MPFGVRPLAAKVYNMDESQNTISIGNLKPYKFCVYIFFDKMYSFREKSKKLKKSANFDTYRVFTQKTPFCFTARGEKYVSGIPIHTSAYHVLLFKKFL